MKICKIWIKGYQQFENVTLDFTNPVNGEPSEKICLIGRNGTGKSTILRLINDLLNNVVFRPAAYLVEFKGQNLHFITIFSLTKFQNGGGSSTYTGLLFLDPAIQQEEDWLARLSEELWKDKE